MRLVKRGASEHFVLDTTGESYSISALVRGGSTRWSWGPINQGVWGTKVLAMGLGDGVPPEAGTFFKYTA